MATKEEKKIKVVYIAGPFSGADGWEIAENVHRAEQAAREVGMPVEHIYRDVLRCSLHVREVIALRDSQMGAAK